MYVYISSHTFMLSSYVGNTSAYFRFIYMIAHSSMQRPFMPLVARMKSEENWILEIMKSSNAEAQPAELAPGSVSRQAPMARSYQQPPMTGGSALKS